MRVSDSMNCISLPTNGRVRVFTFIPVRTTLSYFASWLRAIQMRQLSYYSPFHFLRWFQRHCITRSSSNGLRKKSDPFPGSFKNLHTPLQHFWVVFRRESTDPGSLAITSMVLQWSYQASMKRQLHSKFDEEVSKCWLLDTSQNKGDHQKQLEESTTFQTQQQQSQNCKSMALFQYFNPFATSWLFLAIENLVANSQSSRDSSYVATGMVFFRI
jgi:hypothetical protein